MKASVITLHTVDNYGSVMQTYATQVVLNKLGYEVEFIDYWRKDNLPTYRAEKLLTNSSTLKKLKPLWGMNGLTKKLAITCLSQMLKRKKSPMWKFLEKYVKLTPIRYCSYAELQNHTPQADVYITGSDQVWNSIWNQGIDKAFFLDFAPADKPRIAFSASIGRDHLDEGEISETKALLEKYKAISVREKTAVELLHSMGIEATLILDPTLMLDAEDWRAIANPVKYSKPYLLIYQLNPNTEMDTYAVKLAEKKGWEIKRIGFGRADKVKSGTCVMLPSVEDFLGLFFQASCVLTDSFHATAFSLNLGLDFISVMPPRFGTRLESVLQLTKTKERMLTNFDDFSIVDLRINKENVTRILNTERAKGLEWLAQVLGDKLEKK